MKFKTSRICRESLEELYGLLLDYSVERAEAELIDLNKIAEDASGGAFRDLLTRSLPLINYLIMEEAPSRFGYIRSAQFVSLMLKDQLALHIFDEFKADREKALTKLRSAEAEELQRLRVKYLS